MGEGSIIIIIIIIITIIKCFWWLPVCQCVTNESWLVSAGGHMEV